MDKGVRVFIASCGLIAMLWIVCGVLTLVFKIEAAMNVAFLVFACWVFCSAGAVVVLAIRGEM